KRLVRFGLMGCNKEGDPPWIAFRSARRCPGQDLNLHELPRYHLKVVRLPVPPPGRVSRGIIRGGGNLSSWSMLVEMHCFIGGFHNRRVVDQIGKIDDSA